MQLANILFGRRCSKSKPFAASASVTHPPTLTCRFVETYDERCPIAGIWSRLPQTDAALDEPEITRPAMGLHLLRRAIHCSIISVRYSTA